MAAVKGLVLSLTTSVVLVFYVHYIAVVLDHRVKKLLDMNDVRYNFFFTEYRDNLPQ